MKTSIPALTRSVSFLLLAGSIQAAQPEPPCVAALHRGIAACLANRFEEARSTLEAALGGGCVAEADPLRVTAVVALARAGQALGELARAADLYDQVLSLADASSIKGEQLLSIAANNLGTMRLHEGRWDEAEPLLARALALSRAIHPEGDPAIGVGMKSLGGLYVLERRWGDAVPVLEGSVTVFRRLGARYNAELAASLTALGLAYTGMGRYDRAMPLLEEAVSLGTAAMPADPALGDALTALGALWRLEGRPARAEPLLQKAAAIYEASGSTIGIRGGSAFTNLGLLRLEEGRYIEARTYLRRAVEVLQQAYGPGHAAVAAAKANLAQCLAVQSQARKRR